MPATTLHVMSFNLRGAYRDPGTDNAWDKRAALNTSVIEHSAPDIIGCQEVQQGNIEYYKQHLEKYERLPGPKYNNSAPFEYNLILRNPAVLEMIESGGFWLSETPNRHSASWDTACVRSANWARLRHRETGLEFGFLNTHLDHVSEEARAQGSKLILSKLPEMFGGELPTILTGDFNCVAGSVTYETFRKAGFHDTFEAADGSTKAAPNTFHGFRGTEYVKTGRPLEAQRIDWILVRGGAQDVRINEFRIIRDQAPPTYPSDHYPILAELEIGNS